MLSQLHVMQKEDLEALKKCITIYWPYYILNMKIKNITSDFTSCISEQRWSVFVLLSVVILYSLHQFNIMLL